MTFCLYIMQEKRVTTRAYSLKNIFCRYQPDNAFAPSDTQISSTAPTKAWLVIGVIYGFVMRRW